MRREAHREIFAFALLFLATFLAVSLFTARPGDSQLEGILSLQVENFCGPLGALAAHHIDSWLGRSAGYSLTLVFMIWGLALLFRRTIRESAWKIVGVVLLLLSISSLEVALTDSSGYLDVLPGGYYGQFSYDFLFSHLDRFGAFLMVFYGLLVALLVSTDTVLYPALVRAGTLVRRSNRVWEAASVLGKRLQRVRIPVAGTRLLERIRGMARSLQPAPAGTGPAPPPGRASGTVPSRRKQRQSAPEEQTIEEEEELPFEDDQAEDPEEAEEEEELEEEEEEELEKEEEESPTRPPLKINLPEMPPPSLPVSRQAPRKLGNYKLPPIDLLNAPRPTVNPLDRSILEETAKKIESTLKHFKIEAQVVEVQKGPVITLYELSLAAGIKVHKIMALSDDLAMALRAPSIRIVAPIPGKSTVGLEVPNRQRHMVGLRELFESPEFRDHKYKIPLLLGKDTAGKPIIGDLGEMPHLLIAGSTGSGKSVCINSIITNILLSKTPNEVKLILVDPKMVELANFEELPHLLTPVVTDMKKAPAVLSWLVEKMEERYELLALVGERNITNYNTLGREKLNEILRKRGEVEEEAYSEIPDHLPHYVMIIDELADMMMTSSKEVEASITRLSQKSRAVGIHIILATQRPSVDVITGLIKANMPSRVSFHVASKVDSRTILDRNGADKLLGKGDLLFLPPGTSNVIRAQGTFISDREIREVVKFVRSEAEPQYNDELSRFGVAGAADVSEDDELYEPAVRVVLESQRGSVTLLQRQLQIGYTRASRLMEIMHQNGLVGPFKGSKAREVYYKLDDWKAAKQKAATAGRRQSDGQAADSEGEA